MTYLETCQGNTTCPEPSYMKFFPAFSSFILVSTLIYYLISEGVAAPIERDQRTNWINTGFTAFVCLLTSQIPAFFIHQTIAGISTAAQLGDAPIAGVSGEMDNTLFTWFMLTTLMSYNTCNPFPSCFKQTASNRRTSTIVVDEDWSQEEEEEEERNNSGKRKKSSSIYVERTDRPSRYRDSTSSRI
jgi:hypothetical protein